MSLSCGRIRCCYATLRTTQDTTANHVSRSARDEETAGASLSHPMTFRARCLDRARKLDEETTGNMSIRERMAELEYGYFESHLRALRPVVGSLFDDVPQSAVKCNEL